MTTIEKLAAVRALMRQRGVDMLLVPSDDHHQSEYVAPHFKARAWLSGFTGSAGTLILTADTAKLFTDGRYYIQAARQIEGSGIDLMKSGSEGVPTPEEYIAANLKGGQTLAYDGRCVSCKLADDIAKKLPESVKIVSDVDFPGLIWNDRPGLPGTKLWALDVKYAGKSHAEKLSDVRAALAEKKCTAFVMSSLNDIAWFYNLRGNDVSTTQTFLSYCIVTETSDTLYADRSAAADVAEQLKTNGVTLRDYGVFYADLAEIKGETVLIDKSAVNAAIVNLLSGCKTVDAKNPTLLMKAKKNEIELENLRRCHIADGLAVTKLMLELKYGEREFDELSVAEYLKNLRRECAERVGVHFIDVSFGTIAAFGANAAMMHYSASKDSNAKIDRTAPVPMLLVDSGGQYLEGTTDITRTFVLGGISDEIRKHYTLTAMGMLRLARAQFLEGATGIALDVLCRQPLWEAGIDYRCGTGHGVGYCLSVHEGPNRFHWKNGSAKLEVGMITTDEPGVYEENSHGIRIENELVTQKSVHNEYGQFLCFENLTFCPIDLDGIDTAYMDRSDIRRLNDYHAQVREVLSPYLCPGDREKLAYLTREV
ncbi:MAG: aminopeptidase P family protein [Clostridia bacterium]|nr:aminopeptidase P family protein [Clostridia bacterium]